MPFSGNPALAGFFRWWSFFRCRRGGRNTRVFRQVKGINGLNANLQGAVGRRGGGEAAVGVKKSIGDVKVPFFPRQVGINVGANGLDVDGGIIKAIFLENVNAGLDFHVVKGVFPARVVSDAVYKVLQVDNIRKCRLPRYINKDRRL